MLCVNKILTKSLRILCIYISINFDNFQQVTRCVFQTYQIAAFDKFLTGRVVIYERTVSHCIDYWRQSVISIIKYPIFIQRVLFVSIFIESYCALVPQVLSTDPRPTLCKDIYGSVVYSVAPSTSYCDNLPYLQVMSQCRTAANVW